MATSLLSWLRTSWVCATSSVVAASDCVVRSPVIATAVNAATMIANPSASLRPNVQLPLIRGSLCSGAPDGRHRRTLGWLPAHVRP